MPEKQLWGMETTKAVENFPISGETVPLPVIHWLARLKGAAAAVDRERGLLSKRSASRVAKGPAEMSRRPPHRQLPGGLPPARPGGPDDGHGAEHPSEVRRARSRPAEKGIGAEADRRPARPLRGAGQPRRAGRALRRAEGRGRLAHEDRRRSRADGIGSPRRSRRDP